jgi:hypothetical protein
METRETFIQNAISCKSELDAYIKHLDDAIKNLEDAPLYAIAID